ncbi:MAG: hypothetical protein ACREJT_00255 [Myxococcota bacterium]
MADQAVPIGQRWINAVPLVAGITYLGPLVTDTLSAVLPAGSDPAALGSLVVGAAMMTAASAVREKLERDARLEAPKDDERIPWSQVLRNVVLQLLARIG